MIETKPCKKCGIDKPLDEYRITRHGSHMTTCDDCRRDAVRATAHARRQEKLDWEQSLRDDVWAAMWRGRSARAIEAVKPKRRGSYTIRLRHERGYISVAELACRCFEREACQRAARSCRTVEAVADAARVLEQPVDTYERTQQVYRLWREELPPSRAAAILKDAQGADEDADVDPFADAMGDWAPAWLQAAPAP